MLIAACLAVSLWAAPVEEFRVALARTDPHDAAALLKLGTWFEGQQTQETLAWAARCYRKAVALGKGPSYAAASLRLAKIELRDKQYQASYRRLRGIIEGGEAQPEVIAEVREVLKKAATETTAKQRRLMDEGEKSFGRGNFAKARDVFAEAYRLLPPGETSADFIPGGDILIRIARCVDAIDDDYNLKTAKPFRGSIQQCARCQKDKGFEECPKCRGEGSVWETIKPVFGPPVKRRVPCKTCNANKLILCQSCRGMRHLTDYKLSSDEHEALDDLIDKVRSFETLKLSLDRAVRDVEKTILQVEKAAALAFFRAMKPNYDRSKRLRDAVKAIPPPADGLSAAAAAWKGDKDIFNRFNFLSSYSIEFAGYLRAYDCLRGTRKRPDFSKPPAAATPPASPVMPEVLSAFPEEGAKDWVAVKGQFEGYEELAAEPEKGYLKIQGSVPHNIKFFVWLPAARPGLERLEGGPWRERVSGLARSYPFAVRDAVRAAPEGRQVVVVGRFLRDRLGFPRNWFEVWGLAVGMTPAQEALQRLLEVPVDDLTYDPIDLGGLALILRFFDVETEFAGIDRAQSISCKADGCPLGIFLDRLAAYLKTTWSCAGSTVTLGDSAAASRDLELVLAELRKAHDAKGYTVEVGPPTGTAEAGPTAAEAERTPGADEASLEERARRAFGAMEYDKAREFSRALADQAADAGKRAEHERAAAKAALFQALTKKTPVSHLAAAATVHKITFVTKSGKKLAVAVAIKEETSSALVVRVNYGVPLRFDKGKFEEVERRAVTREAWRAEKMAELQELEQGAHADAPRERANALFLAALFCKTNRIADRGTAALEKAIADDGFAWILDTYFPAEKPALDVLWRQAASREAGAAPAEVAKGPDLAGEVDPDAPLPASPEELRRVAKALCRDGNRALSRALPGMDEAGAWRKEALKRFSKAKEALAKLSGIIAFDAELEALNADVAFMIGKCVKDLGFFD